MCRDVPIRQCWEWHVLPRCRKARHRKHDDGTDDPYSVRVLCPAHNDREASLSMSLEDGRVKWQCFACGKDATARVRLALIREYGIPAECLPLPAREKQDVLDLLEQILSADSADHAAIRLRALAALEGYADLPRGAELARIAERANVGLASAYRARKALPQVKTANPSTYSPAAKPVKPRRSA